MLYPEGCRANFDTNLPRSPCEGSPKVPRESSPKTLGGSSQNSPYEKSPKAHRVKPEDSAICSSSEGEQGSIGVGNMGVGNISLGDRSVVSQLNKDPICSSSKADSHQPLATSSKVGLSQPSASGVLKNKKNLASSDRSLLKDIKSSFVNEVQ
jgi:hypothetical protein